MACGILQQVIFRWLSQSTVIVSNNLEARSIHRIKQQLGGNANLQDKIEIGRQCQTFKKLINSWVVVPIHGNVNK